jgi:hypothetical protein
MATPFDLATQRCNFDRFFAVDREMPIGKEFVAAQFDPRLHQTKLFSRQVTLHQLTRIDAEYRFLTLVLGMNVGKVVLLIVKKIHADNDAKKTLSMGMVSVLLAGRRPVRASV